MKRITEEDATTRQISCIIPKNPTPESEANIFFNRLMSYCSQSTVNTFETMSNQKSTSSSNSRASNRRPSIFEPGYLVIMQKRTMGQFLEPDAPKLRQDSIVMNFDYNKQQEKMTTNDDSNAFQQMAVAAKVFVAAKKILALRSGRKIHQALPDYDVALRAIQLRYICGTSDSYVKDQPRPKNFGADQPPVFKFIGSFFQSGVLTY